MNGQDLIAILPVIVLVAGSVLTLLYTTILPARKRLLLAGIGTAIAAIILSGVEPSVAIVGNMFSTSLYSRFFTGFWAFTALLTLLFSWRMADRKGFAVGEYISMVLFAAAGMSILSSATSFVGLFVGLEAFTLVFYILIAFDLDSVPGMEGGLKYLVLGGIATGFLALAIALLYTVSGSFVISEVMSAIFISEQGKVLGITGLAILLVAFGFKISLVPFHLWTPDVYQGSPSPVGGFLASGSKGASVSILITIFALIGSGSPELRVILSVMAVGSMIIGSVCAVRQNNIKRMLGYSSVVHMGFIAIGLATSSIESWQAMTFYIVTYAIANIAAFGILESFSSPEKTIETYHDLSGLSREYPVRSAVFAIIMFSMAGFPPLAGFIAKILLFKAALLQGHFFLVSVAIVASIVSAYYYLMPLKSLYMSKESQHAATANFFEKVAIALCLTMIVILGVIPSSLIDFIKVMF